MAKLTRKLSQVGQEALERLELPVNLAGGVARIELLGNREVYMDRHCGVLAYTTENIDVNGGTVTSEKGAFAVVEIHADHARFTVYDRAVAEERNGAVVYTRLPARCFVRDVPLRPRG